MGRALATLCTAILLALLPACAPLRPTTLLEETVIEGEELWRGDVRIRGKVTVKKGARLQIRPGTRVFFEPLDLDGDGIGDGEILVEGSFQALGTAELPILLTSAGANPKPGDWKFLYFDFARDVRIAHMISEYAYSGVQIHFCKAQITDSEFRHNVDGVRFSTAHIELAGNLIHHNRNGIRFEERRGGGRVHHNRISDNEVGIFAVTRAENRTVFELNNIVDNSDYQVKMGLEQSVDLSFPRNWWGRGDASAQRFLDFRYDSKLGRVSAPEPLSAPVDLSRRQGLKPSPSTEGVF